nr:VT2 [synthetic construct]
MKKTAIAIAVALAGFATVAQAVFVRSGPGGGSGGGGSTPDCVTGKVEYTKYNDDDTFTVKVGDKELATNRANLQSLLLSAQITGMTVTIKTNACHNGGTFSEVIFRGGGGSGLAGSHHHHH